MDGVRNLVSRCPLSFPLGLGVGESLQLLFFPPHMRFLLFVVVVVVVFEKQPIASHPHGTRLKSSSQDAGPAGEGRGPSGGDSGNHSVAYSLRAGQTGHGSPPFLSPPRP